jgi:capsule polysaccharide export protein KpsE/RkpR
MTTEQRKTEDKARLDFVDLTIRNRVLALKAALEATNVPSPARDALLAQFEREVEDLQNQLGTVEKQFGKNTPMAQILREALESAQCRLETRRIELGMEDDEESGKRTEKPISATSSVHPSYDWLWAAVAFGGTPYFNHRRAAAPQYGMTA